MLAQSKLLSLPTSSVLNFANDPENPVISDLPVHPYELGPGVFMDPHDEVQMKEIYDELQNDEIDLFEKYRGQHPKYCQKIVSDKDGNILFFIVDNNIYNKYGESFQIEGYEDEIAYLAQGEIQNPECSNYTPSLIIGTDFNRFNDFFEDVSNYWVLDSEIVVSPIRDGCLEFIIVYSVHRIGAGNFTSEIFYRKLKILNSVYVEITNPIAFTGHNDETNCPEGFLFDDAIMCNNFNKCHLGVTNFRFECSNSLLFFNIGHSVYVYEIDASGNIDMESRKGFFLDSSIIGTSTRSEFEVKETTETDGNKYYYIAFSFSGIDAVLFVGKFDYFGNYINHWQVIIDDTGDDGLNIFRPIKGLEFSETGKYLFITYFGQTTIKYLDLSGIPDGNPPIINQLNISNPEYFEYSQIETGFNNKLYFLGTNSSNSEYYIASLLNSDFPDPINWNIQTVDNLYFNSVSFLVSPGLNPSEDSKSLIFMDQADDYNFDDYYNNLPEGCCIDKSVTFPDDYVWQTNEVWEPNNNPFNAFSNTIVVNDMIDIPENTTVTIKDLTLKFTVHNGFNLFSGNTGIGSHLILDNTKIGAVDVGDICDVGLFGRWRGIVLNGNGSSQYPLSLSAQPILEIVNNSIIEKANTGVLANSGAVVIAENSSFVNNLHGVTHIGTPNNVAGYENKNASVFTNCNFVTNLDITVYPLLEPDWAATMISLQNADNININKCRFSNSFETTDNHLFGLMGIGIDAFGSNFFVNSSLVMPCELSNNFNNLYYGIRAFGGNNIQVKNACFNNNIRGMYLGDVETPEIIMNNFEVEEYGLYLDACSNFDIQENSFNGGTTGMFVRNTGETNQIIYKNYFNNNLAGTTLIGNNSDYISEAISLPDFSRSFDLLGSGDNGLQLKCMQYNNVEYGIHIHTGNMRRNQGMAASPALEEFENQPRPAGNTFTNRIASGSDFYVSPGNPSDLDVPFYNYFQHNSVVTELDNVDEDKINANTQIFTTGYNEDLACPSNYSLTVEPVGDLLEELTVISIDIDNSETELAGLIDNGNTPLLLSKVEQLTQINYIASCLELLQSSPYLSDVVLIEFINNSIYRPIAKSAVILVNSPLSPKVRAELPKLNVGPFLMYLLNLAQNGIGQKEQKQNELAALKTEKQSLLNRLYKVCYSDQYDSPIKQEIITALNSLPDLDAKMFLTLYYLGENNYGQFQKTLVEINSIIANLPEEKQIIYEFWPDLLSIIKQIQQNPTDDNINTLVKLNLPLIERITTEENKGSVTAGFLLELGGYGLYSEPVYLPKLAPKTMAVNIVPGNSILDEDELINIYPNPVTNGQVCFEYYLVSGKPILTIVDISGRIVENRVLSSRFGLETLDISNLDAGEYFLIIGELKGRFTIVK